MGSEVTKIPVIDFSKGSSDIKVQVTEALAEYGIFEAVFPDITEECLRPLFHGVRQLVDLPVEMKQKCPNGNVFPGYIPTNPHVPLFQTIGIEDPHVLQNLESATKALWPDHGNPKLCKMWHSYIEKVKKYEQMVRTIVAESLGIEAYLDEHMEACLYSTRALKYDPPMSGEAQQGLTAHNDAAYLTITIQMEDTNGYGLQMQTKDGKWIDIVNPPPFTFVVVAGAALGVWTNGRVRPCFHQVIMSGKQSRHSLTFAAIPKPGYKIMPPGELIDKDHPLLFEPYEYKYGIPDPIIRKPFK